MPLEDKIHVLVIDSNSIVRKSLIAVLEQFPDLAIVGEAEDGESGITLVGQLEPHVVLINLMEMTNAVATTVSIRQNYPNTQVIIVSSFGEYGLIQQAFRAGAINYLLNTATEFELAEAIRQAYIGKTTLAVEAVSALMASITSGRKSLNFSTRERQVLELMVQGLDNQQIAVKMDMSRSTVKNNINSLFSKLKVNSRVKAVAMTLQYKLLDES